MNVSSLWALHLDFLLVMWWVLNGRDWVFFRISNVFALSSCFAVEVFNGRVLSVSICLSLHNTVPFGYLLFLIRLRAHLV